MCWEKTNMSYNTKNLIHSPEYLTRKQNKKKTFNSSSFFFFNKAMFIKKQTKTFCFGGNPKAPLKTVKILEQSECICMGFHKCMNPLFVDRLNSKKHLSFKLFPFGLTVNSSCENCSNG